MPGLATRQMAVRDVFTDGVRDACVTTEGLARLSGLDRRAVTQAVAALVCRGYLVRRVRGCFELTEAGKASLDANEQLCSGPTGPHTGKANKTRARATLRDKAWRALRIMRKATVEELLERGVVGGEANPHNNIGRYLKALTRAGYIQEMARRTQPEKLTSNGCKRWMLIRDTGPKAPVIRADGAWDHNLDRVFAFDAPETWSDQP